MTKDPNSPATSADLPPTLGPQVCEFIETYCVHGPGDVAGEPVELTLDQRKFIYEAYEYVRDPSRPLGWRRRYRRACLSRRKGFAKSELAAFLIAAEAVGPVRLGGFDADGNPIGVPVKVPRIPVAATSEEQAEETLYGVFRAIATEGPLADVFGLDVGVNRTFVPGGGEIKVVSASSAARDGALPTFSPCDETHLWANPQLRKLHATLRRNTAKRKDADAWMLETTTAFLPGQGSVAEASHDYGKKILAGEVSDATFLYDWLAASEKWDLAKRDERLAAIKEASGLAWSFTNVAAILDEYEDPAVDESQFRRYWLNQVWAGPTSWADPDEVKARGVGSGIAPGRIVVLGFDGSESDDSTALVATDVETGEQQLVGLWEQPEDMPKGWHVPRAEVTSRLEQAVATWRVARLYADPPYWTSELIAWEQQFPEVAVVSFPTNSRARMHAVLHEFRTAMTTGAWSHSNQPEFVRHLLNMTRVERGQFILVGKPEGQYARKIDAGVAAAISWQARLDELADPSLSEDNPLAYIY